MILTNTTLIKASLNIVFFLLMLFPIQGIASDLLCAYELAIANDTRIKSAKAAFLAAREAIPQARALFLPVISASSTNTYYNYVYDKGNLSVSTFSIPITQTHFAYDQNVYGVTFNQPVFYYQQWVQYSKASSQVKAANATYGSAEQDLILRTITAYFNVLKAINAVKFAKALRKAYWDTLQQVSNQYSVGVISTLTDVDQAKARYVTALSQEISAENNLSLQKQLLAEITCIQLNEFSELREDVKLTPPAPENVCDWISSALEQNLDLLSARFQTEAARKDITINGANHLPTLDINGGVIRSTATKNLFSEPGNVNSYVALQINVPILSGGAVSSKTRQATFLYEETLNQMKTLYRQVETAAKQSFLNVMTQLSLISANYEAVNANKEALDATRQSYNAGLKNLTDVLNAQSDLVQSQQNYENARYDYIINRAQLKQAAGMLCPEEIFKINTWLASCPGLSQNTDIPTKKEIPKK